MVYINLTCENVSIQYYVRYAFNLTLAISLSFLLVNKGVVIKGVNGSDYLFLSQYHVGSDSWALVILRRQLLQAYMSIRSTGQVCDTLKTNAHPNFVVSRELPLPLLCSY